MRSACRTAGLAGLLIVLLSGLAAVPAPALAGAWTRAPGGAQLITTVGRQQVPFRQSEEAEGDAASDTFQIYGEYGLAEGLTVGGSFWLEVAPSDLDRGSALIGGFARKQLWQSEAGSVASVQLSAAAPVERWISEEFARSKPFSTAEIGLRALYGKSWWGDWGSAFLSTEAGYHLRFEDQPNEIRADATAGFEPWPCCAGMVSLHGLLPDGEGDTDTSLKLAPSLVWHLRRPGGEKPDLRRSSLQLGLAYDLLQPEDGIGVFLGAWQEF